MFHVIALKGCPYSERAVESLKNYPYPLKYKVVWVDGNTKANCPGTFPQITYQSPTRKITTIGGCDNLIPLLEKYKPQHINAKV